MITFPHNYSISNAISHNVACFVKKISSIGLFPFPWWIWTNYIPFWGHSILATKASSSAGLWLVRNHDVTVEAWPRTLTKLTVYLVLWRNELLCHLKRKIESKSRNLSLPGVEPAPVARESDTLTTRPRLVAQSLRLLTRICSNGLWRHLTWL